MNEQVIEALKLARYKVLTEEADLEQLFRLRYACYRAEGSIAENDAARMTDPFDRTPNCVHVGVEIEGRIQAAVRLHLVSDLCREAPTLEVFPEITETLIGPKQTLLDPTRFVVDQSARTHRVPLHFLALRIPFLATVFYDIDLALAPVREEHVPFYSRYLRYQPVLDPRSYPGLKKPIHLMTADVRKQREAVLARAPVFGPIPDMPEADIAFPRLGDAYAAPRRSGIQAA